MANVRERMPGRFYPRDGKGIPTETGLHLSSIPDPPMLLPDLIPRGAIILVTGPSHCGKTFFALELARSGALCESPFSYFPIPQEFSSLFIEQDAPKVDTGRVAWAMLGASQVVDEEFAPANHPFEHLRFLWHQDINLWRGVDVNRVIDTANQQSFHHGAGFVAPSPIFDEHGDVIDYEGGGTEEHIETGVDLIVWDSMRACHTGEENDSGEMEQIMQEFKYIRSETGASQLILHHENARGERPRGNTAIEAAADIIYRLSRKGSRVTARCVKGRIIQPPSFRFDIIRSDDSKSVRFVDLVEANPQKEAPDLLTFLRSPASRESALAWAEKNGISTRTFDRLLASLKQSGKIQTTRSSGSYLYSAT